MIVIIPSKVRKIGMIARAGSLVLYPLVGRVVR